MVYARVKIYWEEIVISDAITRKVNLEMGRFLANLSLGVLIKKVYSDIGEEQTSHMSYIFSYYAWDC